MNLTEVVPQGTNAHTFIEIQQEYFGFYDMYIVTKVTIAGCRPSLSCCYTDFHNCINKV